MSWRFPIYQAHGDGTETLVDPSVPFSGVDMQIALNGADDFQATVKPVVPRLRGLIREDSTVVYAVWNERDVFGAWAVDQVESAGGELSVSGTDLLYRCLSDVPYEGTYKKVNYEGMEIARHILDYAQEQPGGNLGIVADSLMSGVLLGKPEKHVEFTTGGGDDVNFDAGPWTLMWWKDDDLKKAFDDVRTAVRFEWMMRHRIDSAGVPHHRLMFGVPRIGRRRADLRFRLGENVFKQPTIAPGDYFSTVVALGAGEGAKMRRATADAPRNGLLRRVKTISDKSWSQSQAKRAAVAEVKAQVESTTDTVAIRDPRSFLAYFPGDELRVVADTGWQDLDYWGRIKTLSISPDDGDDVQVEFESGDDGDE